MTDIPRKETTADVDCGGCTLHDALNAPAAIERREFLRAGALALASLGFLGLGSRTAGAMEVGEVSALAPKGSDGRTEKRYPIPTVDGASIDKDNDVILVRWQNAVYAFALSCPHQNTALKWDERDHAFQCPKHHSKFQPDGAYIPGSGRATRNMDRYAIQVQGNGVIVDLDKVYEEDSDGTQWAAAVIHLDGKVSANSKS